MFLSISLISCSFCLLSYLFTYTVFVVNINYHVKVTDNNLRVMIYTRVNFGSVNRSTEKILFNLNCSSPKSVGHSYYILKGIIHRFKSTKEKLKVIWTGIQGERFFDLILLYENEKKKKHLMMKFQLLKKNLTWCVVRVFYYTINFLFYRRNT